MFSPVASAAGSASQISYKQADFPNTYAGLLAQARSLNAWLAEQPEAVLESNDWLGTTNDQIAYVLQKQPILVTHDPGRSVPNAIPETIEETAEIQRRATLLDGIAELLELVQSQAVYPAVAEFSVPSLIAGTSTEFLQTYRVPDLLPQNTVLVIASRSSRPEILQAIDSGAANFISVSTSGQARVQLEAYALSRGAGERETSKLYPAVRIVDGELNSGDTVTVRYQNFRVPERTQANFTLPIYIVYPGYTNHYGIPATGITIVADEAVRLQADAPSIVKPGQNFEVNLQLVDRYGNFSFGATPSLDLLVDGVFRRRIDRSSNAAQSFSLTLEEPGIKNLELRSGGGGLRTSINPIRVSQNADYELKWVDLNQRGNTPQGEPEFLPGTETTVFEVERDLNAGGNTVVLTRTPDIFESLESRVLALATPGSRGSSMDTIHMAVPYVPTDIRAFSPVQGRLVEVVSGDTTFAEFGLRHAIQGNRIGFTGSGNPGQLLSGRPAVFGTTAVWLKSGETIFDALLESRTYVTSGAKILLDVEVNGGMPGSRVDNQPARTIAGMVSGTSGIVAVELLKNGEVIDRISYGNAEADNEAPGTELDDADPNSESIDAAINEPANRQLRVSFYSSSAPFRDQVDYPRNGREWIGYLKLTGGDIQNAKAPGFRNESRQGVALHPREDNRVDFITWTRGQESSFLVQADFSDDNAVFEINLKAGREDQMSKPALREPATFSGSRQLLSLAELDSGPVERVVDIDGYRDRMRFELLDEELPTTQVFQFQDGGTSISRAGDFYYVRAIQLDDHFAISSPVWIGGFDVLR